LKYEALILLKARIINQRNNLYCALEDLFKGIAETFENHVEDLSRYHQELLKRMAFEIPGIRPQILSAKSYELLEELRRFRHLYRHAYTYDLDKEEVLFFKKKIMNSWKNVESDLSHFEAFIEGVLKK
jgi:hypothetical protein